MLKAITVNNSVQAQIIEEVLKERKRQEFKHGKKSNGHSPHKWLVILSEEMGEVSHAVLENNLSNYYEELVQVAAVAMAALEDLANQIAKE